MPPKINKIFNVIMDNRDTTKVIEAKIKDNFFSRFITKIVEHNINKDPSNRHRKQLYKIKGI
jgi:hypothetical protein